MPRTKSKKSELDGKLLKMQATDYPSNHPHAVNWNELPAAAAQSLRENKELYLKLLKR